MSEIQRHSSKHEHYHLRHRLASVPSSVRFQFRGAIDSLRSCHRRIADSWRRSLIFEGNLRVVKDLRKDRADSERRMRQRFRSELTFYSDLEYLPESVLSNIMDLLPISSCLNFRQASPLLRFRADFPTNDLKDKLMTIETYYNGALINCMLADDRFVFLGMLEKDRKLQKSFTCSRCRTSRNVSHFTMFAIRQRPSDRKCRSCTPIQRYPIWFCTHSQTPGYGDDNCFPLVAETIQDTSAVYFSRPLQCTSSCGSCSWPKKFVSLKAQPLLANRTGIFEPEDATRALRSVSLSRCRHMKVLDPDLSQTFLPTCDLMPWTPCKCDECIAPRSCRRCEGCNLSFEFEVERMKDGRWILSVVTRERRGLWRWFGGKPGDLGGEIAFRLSDEADVRDWGRFANGLEALERADELKIESSKEKEEGASPLKGI